MTSATAPQRLFLHVGLPKSGTSHLQALLAENRPALREAGFVYPFVRPEGMFHAAVELRGQEELWGLPPDVVRGTWQQLLDRVRSRPAATGVLSHEILAGAAPEVVERVVRSAGDLELHVVVTARDLARQAVAHWQEEVKNGRPWSFGEFERVLFEPSESVTEELGFWRSQDLPDVLARWGRHVPAERIHLVTVPPAGGDAGELRRRFEEAVGLPAGVLPGSGSAAAANRSLGVAEVALLREVVTALDGRLPQPAYAHVVKRWFAQGKLAALGGRRPQAPPALAARLREVATGWVERLAQEGYAVHGDLADLVPTVDEAAPHPDDVPVAERLASAPRLLADLLVEVARQRAEAPAGAPPHPGPDDRHRPRRWLPRGRPRA